MVKTRSAWDNQDRMKHYLETPSDSSKPNNGKATNGKAVHTSPSAQSFVPLVEAVALRAYLLHENHGFAHGHDVDDWLAAEAAIRAEQSLANS